MSFDLYFYTRKDNPIAEAAIAQYLTKNVVAADSEFSRQWMYENTATHVYFTIEWNKADDGDEDDYPGFEDFRNSNFSCSINYFRPNFFALETFPIIERFINDLDLFVYDPQSSEGDVPPGKYSAAELIKSYSRSNDRVSKGQHKEYNLGYMPLEKSNAYWQYQFNRAALEESIKEDIYIPNLFIIKETATGLLYTGCAWTTHVPLVLPKVDIVVIQKKYKKLFSSVEETGIVWYDTVIKEMGNYFDHLPGEVPDLRILNQQNADKLSRKFNQLKIYKTIAEFGTGASANGFVNVAPDDPPK